MTKYEAIQKINAAMCNDDLEGAEKVLGEYASMIAVGYGKWLSGHKLDFQPAMRDKWIGLNMQTYSNEELFQLFIQQQNQ